jgi:hypothetical protein
MQARLQRSVVRGMLEAQRDELAEVRRQPPVQLSGAHGIQYVNETPFSNTSPLPFASVTCSECQSESSDVSHLKMARFADE